MLNVVDLLWIRYEGMSIITAIFFAGAFLTISAICWWVRKELSYIYEKLSDHCDRLNNNKDELSELSTQLAVIRTIVKKTDKSMDKLVDKIYK